MNTLFDLTFQQLFYRLAAAAITIGVHGYLIGLAARLFGDRGPTYDGRVTLNPLQHVEPVGGLAFLIFRLGWIRPVTIDPAQLRGGRGGLVVVAAGTLLVTLLLAFVPWLLRPLVWQSLAGTFVGFVLVGFLETLTAILVGFVALNWLPIPPLTGGYLLQAIAPRAYAHIVARSWIPGLMVAALVFLGPLADGIAPVRALMESWVMR